MSSVISSSRVAISKSEQKSSLKNTSKHAEINADELLRRADEVRNPSLSFEMQVEVNSPQAVITKSEFLVFVKGKDKTLIRTLAPKINLGRNLLMLNEEMYAQIPSLGRAVRVSLNQKLSGEAANGDIARTRWWGDYTPILEKVEKEKGKQNAVLLMKANKNGLTYEQIRLWVDIKNGHPIKAEYLTGEGKLLKNAKFLDYVKMEGDLRPRKIEIEDILKEKKSVIKILSMKKSSFNDTFFTKENLK